jgi:hypothetical protein
VSGRETLPAPGRRGRLVLGGWLVALAAVLGVATVQASLEEDVLSAGRRLLADRWGRATLIDTYGAFVAAWLPIAARERRPATAVGWLLAVLLTGNFALCAYLLLALWRLPRGASWRDLFTAARPARAAEPGASR